jgi:hypothetical protein
MTCTARIHAAGLCKQQSCSSSTPIWPICVHTQLTSELHIKAPALHSTYTPLSYPNHGPPLTTDAQARRASFRSLISRPLTDAAPSRSSMPRGCTQRRAKQSTSSQRGCSTAARPRRTRPHPSSTVRPRGSRPYAGQQDETELLSTQKLRENGRHRPAEGARCSGRTRNMRVRGKNGRGHVISHTTSPSARASRLHVVDILLESQALRLRQKKKTRS